MSTDYGTYASDQLTRFEGGPRAKYRAHTDIGDYEVHHTNVHAVQPPRGRNRTSSKHATTWAVWFIDRQGRRKFLGMRYALKVTRTIIDAHYAERAAVIQRRNAKA